MKKLFKSLAALIVTAVALLSLVGCSGGISGGEAKAHVNGFFEAVRAEDYDKAKTFLHPELADTDLKAFFEGMEGHLSADIATLELDKYTGFKTSFYNSDVGGSAYSLNMDVKVSGKTVGMIIEIVRNDDGYGIYGLDVNP